MELRATRELRRNARMEQTAPKKGEGSPEGAKAPTKEAPKQPADQLSLSQQALAYAEEQRQKLWGSAQEEEGRHQGHLDSLLDAMESKKDELDSMSEKLKTLSKCQKIAAAIMRGDRVPPEDLRYLMEHDKEGYKMALAMRRPKKDPEEVESVLDEEDRNGGRTEEAGGGEAPAVEGAGASEGGGEAGPGSDS